ncbi:MAG: WD40/YVTN/BNR-like repeat-containing protein, partial [Bryobacteraceae bacterium]
MRIRNFAISFLVLAVLAAQEGPKPAQAKPDANDPWQEATFRAFRLRSIGPALLSGRVTVLVAHPTHPATWIAGVASGGVWKTTNAGTTWTPIFQNEGSYSIGDVAMDPRDPNVLWVGTGERNAQRSVGYGDGVYRSADGGRTWKNMGLKQSGNIGRIVIDPRDSNVVYVAAQGPLWSAGGERGLYKTTDGGQTWTQVLKVSENTGVTDVATDPFNPDVLLAAAHQRRRHVWTLIH